MNRLIPTISLTLLLLTNSCYQVYSRSLGASLTNISKIDSIYEQKNLLKEVSVFSDQIFNERLDLPDFVETNLFIGKKIEFITVKKLESNLANQTFRQVFSRTPGLHIVESDPSGLNTSISIRGLSANRSWDFNMRQNGYDMTPDPMGYNEAYYTPSLEWVQKIQIIRGSAALQYGSQVGGLVNYELEAPSFNKSFGGSIQHSVGSFGLNSNLITLKGGNQRVAFIGSNQVRFGDGFRPNSNFTSNQSYGRLDWKLNDSKQLIFELTHAVAQAKQGGGLSQMQFDLNPNVSNRGRNHFGSTWLMPVLKFSNQISPHLLYSIQAVGNFSGRTQLGVTKGNDFEDVKNKDGAYSERQLDNDQYRSFGSEFRLLYHGNVGKHAHHTSLGARYFQGNMERGQQARGSIGQDYDPNPLNAYPRNLNFKNENLALFSESAWEVNKQVTWTFGFRFEHINSSGKGSLGVLNNVVIPYEPTARIRNFVLFGTGFSYKPKPEIELYTNVSQSFRPVSFSDLLPTATFDVIDPKLKDADAVNFDLGLRGNWSRFIRFDINVYYLKYNNRIGNLSQIDEQKKSYLYKTNLGASSSQGLDIYVEWNPLEHIALTNSLGNLNIYTSVGITQAEYLDYVLPTGLNLRGKAVEYAPATIIRSGLNYKFRSVSISYQISQTSSTFSDAQNTKIGNALGTVGEIPSYTLQDISMAYKISKNWIVKGAINNVANTKYFTRRGTGAYPGIGILPGEPVNFIVSASFQW